MIEQIEEIMLKNGIRELDRITVTIGALSGVDEEAFAFAFPMVVEGTPLEEVALSINSQPVEVLCRNCHQQTSPEPIFLRCLSCGSAEVDVKSGRDLLIQSLEYTDKKKCLAQKDDENTITTKG